MQRPECIKVSCLHCLHCAALTARGMQIIQVNLTSEDLQPITAGSKVEFTYSVTWAETSIHFNRRFERYLDYNFFEHQVPIFLIASSRVDSTVQRANYCLQQLCSQPHFCLWLLPLLAACLTVCSRACPSVQSGRHTIDM